MAYKVYTPLDLQYTPTTTQAARFSDTVVYSPHRIWYVDKDTASTSQDGSIKNPYDSIQDAINAIGDAVDAATYQECHAIDTASGTYIENLIFPHRAITIMGSGVKISGNITRNVDSTKEFGVSSSTFRAGLAFIGNNIDGRSSHPLIRSGIRITGSYTEVLAGGSATNHDLILNSTRIDGDIVIPSDVGNVAAYIDKSRLNGNFTGASGFYLQRCVSSQLNGTTIRLPFVIYMDDVEFNGSGATNIYTASAFGDGTEQKSIRRITFFQSVTWDVTPAGQTIKCDKYAWNYLKNVTWTTNTPTITILDANEYSSSITWDGSGPYTYTVSAATHKLGVSKNLNVKVFENDNQVGVDISVNSAGQVVITSNSNFSNASVLISR